MKDIDAEEGHVQGFKRKVVYVLGYEGVGLLISTVLLTILSGNSPTSTGALAVIIMTIAATWNMIFNYSFEAWESSRKSRTRTLSRRILHAILFQLSIVSVLIPVIAWWMNISLLDALLLDFALILIFPVYTFFYNWVFDKIFGLPTSAIENPELSPCR
ncbi:putative membrane protein [Rhodococcus sp. 27YEA15]|uniref:PACE efflux transporter n=1 Tax=Rhodococcus sp. 27YEA15 TaxID=3156259 RepID=UPI003C7A3D20